MHLSLYGIQFQIFFLFFLRSEILFHEDFCLFFFQNCFSLKIPDLFQYSFTKYCTALGERQKKNFNHISSTPHPLLVVCNRGQNKKKSISLADRIEFFSYPFLDNEKWNRSFLFSRENYKELSKENYEKLRFIFSSFSSWCSSLSLSNPIIMIKILPSPSFSSSFLLNFIYNFNVIY